MSRSSNCFLRADGRSKWLWHIRFTWFMSLFTSLPPAPPGFMSKLPQHHGCSCRIAPRTWSLSNQFSLLLGCFCHQHFQQKMQFNSIKMCSQRTADFSGNDGDFGALFSLLFVQGRWLWMLHAGIVSLLILWLLSLNPWC